MGYEGGVEKWEERLDGLDYCPIKFSTIQAIPCAIFNSQQIVYGK